MNISLLLKSQGEVNDEGGEEAAFCNKARYSRRIDVSGDINIYEALPERGEEKTWTL